MAKLNRGARLLNRYSNHLLALSALGLVLPLLLLAGVGAYAVFRLGLVLPFAALLVLCALLVVAPQWLLKRKQAQHSPSAEHASLVQPAADWAPQEMHIWHTLNASITQKLAHNSSWPALRGHSLALALEVAQAYGKQELDFTVPEGLQLLEEISRRYRNVLHEHVPMVDAISIAQGKKLYHVHDKYGAPAKEVYRYAMLGWRALRMSNPVTGLAGELRSKLLGAMSQQAYANLQTNTKRALLQEVVKVSMDLYSGRFVMQAPPAAEPQQQAALGPVRICVVGQVNAGKSSLVNALLTGLQAEVDALPATEGTQVYPCVMAGEEQLCLVDTAGLDGSAAALRNACSEITQADIVLWVLKANQPARQLDQQLKEKVDAFYAQPQHISRLQPVFIGVLNQVDLLAPTQEWAPPYLLSDTTNAKVQTMQAAQAHNCTALGFNIMLPLALPPAKPWFGLPALQAEIQAQFEQAQNVQLNRRRTSGKATGGLGKQTARLFKASQEVAKRLL